MTSGQEETDTIWTRSWGVPPPTQGYLLILLAPSLLFTFELLWRLGESGFIDTIAFRPPAGNFELTVLVWAFTGILPIIALGILLGISERRVGVGPGGVTLVSRLRIATISWDELDAQFDHPGACGSWTYLTYHPREGPTAGMFIRRFWATRGQVRAILESPFCPTDRFGPVLRSWASQTSATG